MSDVDDAVEKISGILNHTGPNGIVSRDKLRALTMAHPSLAAALGELLALYNYPVPGLLRHAMHNERQTGGRD